MERPFPLLKYEFKIGKMTGQNRRSKWKRRRQTGASQGIGFDEEMLGTSY